MTIEQLVGKSAEELEKMTDAEILSYFEPYLQFVRPTTEQVEEVKTQAPAKKTFGKDRLQNMLAMLDKRLEE